MSEECTHNCSTCTSNCGSKKESLLVKPNKKGHIGHVVGIVSGKGGVGKSLVTSMLAVLLQRRGYRVGILDADITGPSIPKAFGMKDVEVLGNDEGMIPPITKTGIEVMSLNLLLGGDESRPVIWRGSIIGGTVQQFWKDTIWDVDILLVDCPPGTGDVPLTVFQSIPLDGVVIVSSPQDLVSMIVSKAANMAAMMQVPVMGIVENMSFVKCPDCGKEIHIFGKSHVEDVAARFGYELLGKIPMDAELARLVDAGAIEDMTADYLNGMVERVIAKLAPTV